MTHRPAPVALRSAAALFALVLCAAAPAGAQVIDNFVDDANPTRPDTLRTLDNPSFITILNANDLPPAPEGFLSYDGGDIAGVIYDFTTPLDITGRGAFAIDFQQIADADDNPLLADIVIILEDGVNFAVFGPSALPFVAGGDLTTIYYPFAQFADINTINRSAITTLAVYFDGQDQIIVASDLFYLVPAPAALPAGLLGLCLLAIRRRHR